MLFLLPVLQLQEAECDDDCPRLLIFGDFFRYYLQNVPITFFLT